MGFGLRAGYTMPAKVYVGANFMYFLGTSTDSTIPGFGTMSTKSSLWTGLVELGYDADLTPKFTLRPTVGLGLASASAEICMAGTCVSDSASKFAFAPGVSASFLASDRHFVGGDFKFLVAGDYNAGIFGGHLGMRF